MENNSERDFIHVSIGQRTDGKKGDVLFGIGIQLDQKKCQTGKILIRAQLGKNGIIIEGEFDPTEIMVHQDAIREAISLAVVNEDPTHRKRIIRRR